MLKPSKRRQIARRKERGLTYDEIEALAKGEAVQTHLLLCSELLTPAEERQRKDSAEKQALADHTQSGSRPAAAPEK